MLKSHQELNFSQYTDLSFLFFFVFITHEAKHHDLIEVFEMASNKNEALKVIVKD